VKFIDGPTGIQVDISFNQLTGLANGRIVSKYLSEYSALRPMVVVLKYFLQARGLNEPYFGGLGSYSLLLLVVSFFQLQVHKSHSAPESNMGYMLIEFFDFYGRVFNWYTTGIRVSNGGCYFNKMDRDWFDASKPYLPSIEDPNDSGS
jgi:non-canonical poly(A) RNA polymerase PAPD5/7